MGGLGFAEHLDAFGHQLNAPVPICRWLHHPAGGLCLRRQCSLRGEDLGRSPPARCQNLPDRTPLG